MFYELESLKSENIGTGLRTIMDEKTDTPVITDIYENSRTNVGRHNTFTNCQCDFTREEAFNTLKEPVIQ